MLFLVGGAFAYQYDFGGSSNCRWNSSLGTTQFLTLPRNDLLPLVNFSMQKCNVASNVSFGFSHADQTSGSRIVEYRGYSYGLNFSELAVTGNNPYRFLSMRFENPIYISNGTKAKVILSHYGGTNIQGIAAYGGVYHDSEWVGNVTNTATGNYDQGGWNFSITFLGGGSRIVSTIIFGLGKETSGNFDFTIGNITIDNTTTIVVAGNQLPSCALRYNQSSFYLSNDTQYFTFFIDAVDPEGDPLYYSQDSSDFQSVYVTEILHPEDPDICDSPKLVMGNGSCAGTAAERFLVMNGADSLFAPDPDTRTLVMNRDSNFAWSSPNALVKEGFASVSFRFPSDLHGVKYFLLDSIGSQALMLDLFVNGTNLTVNLSGLLSQYKIPNLIYNASDPRDIVIDFWNFDETGVVPQHDAYSWHYLSIRQSPGDLVNGTSILGSPIAIATAQVLPYNTNLGHVQVSALRFGGFTAGNDRLWSTSVPGPVMINDTGTRTLNFYVSDALHYPDEYCKMSVAVSASYDQNFAHPEENFTSNPIPPGAPVASTPMGAVGGVFYGLIHGLGLESTLYPFTWLAYLIFIAILFLGGLELGGAWAIANLVFFILGLFSLASWGQTLSFLVMFLISCAGTLTKQFGPFGGVGGSPFQKSEGISWSKGGKED